MPPRITSDAIERLRKQPGTLSQKRAAKLIELLSTKKGTATPSPSELQDWLFALCRALLLGRHHGGAEERTEEEGVSFLEQLPKELMSRLMSKLQIDDLARTLRVNKTMSVHVRAAVRDMCAKITERRLDSLPSRNVNDTYMKGKGRFQDLYEYILKTNKGGLRFQSIILLYKFSIPIYHASKMPDNEGVEMAGRGNIIYSAHHGNDASLTATMYHNMPKDLDRFLSPQANTRLVNAIYYLSNYKYADKILRATQRAMKKRFDERNFEDIDGMTVVQPHEHELENQNYRENWVKTTADRVILENSVFKDYDKLMELAMDAEIAYILCSLAPT